MPDVSYVTKDGLDRVDARLSAEIKENAKHIKQNSEAIVKLETLYGTLVKLPDAIASLEKTVVGVNHNLESMNTRINQVNESIMAQKNTIKELREENQKQNENISKVDNKGKIDLVSGLSGNFWGIIWKVILVVAALLVAYKSLVG